MIETKREFALGYAKPVHRGVYFWLDNEKRRNMPIDHLIYEALGDAYDLAWGADLKGITISIEIEEVNRPGLRSAPADQ